MKKTRILFFVPLPPPVHGPALRNESLVKSKIINQSFELDILPFAFVEETNEIGKFSWTKIGKAITRAWQIFWKLTTRRPDLVYLNPSLYGFALYRDWFYILIFKSFKVKLLYHLRTQGVRRQAEEDKLKRKMFTWMFKNERVICLSNNLHEDIRTVCPEPPLIIPNGVEDVSPAFPNRTASPTLSILFLANLARTKGVIELLKAFKILKDRSVSFEGLIVGDAGDLSFDFVKTTIEDYQLADRVKLLGPKYGNEKFQILRNADILALPTYFEAFPGIVLEAMQFEVPVVSTFEGAIPEIVDHEITGLLVKKLDVVGLAGSLEILANDKNLRVRMGRNGRVKFLREYTLEKFENNMKNAFQYCTST